MRFRLPSLSYLADVPGPVGLAVIVVPAKLVMGALDECGPRA